MKRKPLAGRRFVRNTLTGALAIRSTPRPPFLTEKTASAFQLDEMLAALIEVEGLLAPVRRQEQVPPALCIAFLADGINVRLTGEEEITSPELRAMLVQFVLTAWSSEKFTPSSAFPYTYDQVVADFTSPPDE